MIKKVILSIGLLFCFTAALYAQVNDARIWVSLGVEKKLTQKLSAVGKYSFRINNNISEVGSLLGELGVNYKLYKRLTLGLRYRYSTKKGDDGTFSRRNRYYASLGYKIKITKPLSVKLTTAYQRQYINVYSSEEGFNASNVFRNEIEFAYKYKKIEPYIGAEVFYYINYSAKKLNRVRGKLGVEYNINKRNKVDVYYMIQQALNEKNPTRAYILSVGYKYVF